MKNKIALYVGSSIFFLICSLMFAIYCVVRLGHDDKAVMLANSQCAFNFENYRSALDLEPQMLAACNGHTSCIVRTSERLRIAYNYPFMNIVTGILRYGHQDKNTCVALSRDINLSYLLCSLIVFLIFIFSPLFLKTRSYQAAIVVSMIPMVFLYPYGSDFLAHLSSIGFPLSNPENYSIGPYPRSHPALLFLPALLFISELNWPGILIFSILLPVTNLAQGSLLNLALCSILGLRLFLYKENLSLYLRLGAITLGSLALLLFGVSQYTATSFKVDYSLLLPTLLNVKVLYLLLLWGLIGITLRGFLKQNREAKFLYLTVLFMLLGMFLLRWYNMPMQKMYTVLSTLMILADRIEGGILLGFYFALLLFFFRYLQFLHSKKVASMMLLLFFLVGSLWDINKWAHLASEMPQIVTKFQKNMKSEFCDIGIELPTSNLKEKILDKTFDPRQETYFHLLFDRSCQGL